MTELLSLESEGPVADQRSEDVSSELNALEQLASAVGASDLFVFRRMAGSHFAHVGGAGRGADWAGIVGADADLNSLGHKLSIGQSVWISNDQPTRILGPYYARSAVAVRPDRDAIVLFGSTADVTISEPPPEDELLATARQAAALVENVSPAKRLADELEILHAVRELVHTGREHGTVDDVLADVARVAADALGCEVAITWMPDGRLNIHEAGWTVVDRGEALGELLGHIWDDRAALPAYSQDATQTPLPYPLDAASGVVSSFTVAIGSPPAALLVLAHTTTEPRGFTQLCRDLAVQLAETAATLLATAVSREGLLHAVVEETRANQELARVNGELELGALHDPLTSLPNRMLLQQQIDRLGDIGRPSTQHADAASVPALLYIDLDGFKAVNDDHGHAVGDAVLVEFATRLRELCRPSDLPARLAGDEFALLLGEPVTGEQALSVANRVVAAAAVPFLMADSVVTIGASVGIAAFTGAAGFDNTQGTLEVLLRRADLAMYRAKTRGRGRAEVFTERTAGPAMAHNRRHGDDPAMARRLRAALAAGALTLHYQPIVDLVTGQVLQVEALARWPQSDGSSIPPAQFIGMAERTGLIGQMGEWALREACRQTVAWDRQSSGRKEVRAVAVNVSVKQLNDPDFLDLVTNVLSETGLDPARLCLEITEFGITMEEDAQKVLLHGLRDRGVLLALDDFGTGGSSLTLMRRLPLNWVKIDGDLIERVDIEPADAVLVRLVIESAHALDLRVCAEGVERHAQLAQLTAMGCDAVQGYLLGSACPPGLLDTGTRTVRDLITSGSRRPLLSGRGQLVGLIDATGTISYLSAESVSLLGYQPRELVGTRALDLVSPGYRGRAASVLRRTNSDMIHPLLRRDGTVVWVEANHQLAHDPLTGELRHVVTTAVDVTDRVLAEDKLADRDRRLQGAVDSAPYGIAMHTEDGVLTQANPALLQFLGCPQDELVGRDLQSFVHPEDVAASTRRLREVADGAQTGRALRTRFVHSDGHPLMADVTVRAIDANSDSPAYLISHIRPLVL